VIEAAGILRRVLSRRGALQAGAMASAAVGIGKSHIHPGRPPAPRIEMAQAPTPIEMSAEDQIKQSIFNHRYQKMHDRRGYRAQGFDSDILAMRSWSHQARVMAQYARDTKENDAMSGWAKLLGIKNW
jgi:hypothetical protein